MSGINTNLALQTLHSRPLVRSNNIRIPSEETDKPSFSSVDENSGIESSKYSGQVQDESLRSSPKATKRHIDPNLLDKVFKLKSKEEAVSFDSNRRSNLYLKTQDLINVSVNDIGIGLDMYV